MTATWYDAWAATVITGRFTPVAYGSLSTVLVNAAIDVWAASWDGEAVVPPGQTIHGHQDQADVPFAGTRVDYSVVDAWLYRAGRGRAAPRMIVLSALA